MFYFENDLHIDLDMFIFLQLLKIKLIFYLFTYIDDMEMIIQVIP